MVVERVPKSWGLGVDSAVYEGFTEEAASCLRHGRWQNSLEKQGDKHSQ